MKLNLVGVILLLLPTVFAQPLGKFLQDADGRIVIAEARNVSRLGYEYVTDQSANELKFVHFYVQTDGSVSRLIMSTEAWKDPLFVASFAIEAFDTDHKQAKSSDRLKKMIVHTMGNIIARELTEEERRELNRYKGSPKRNSSDFEMVYDRGQIRAETSGLRDFDLFASKEERDPFSVKMAVTREPWKYSEMALRNDANRALSSLSFAIVSNPERKSKDCLRDKVAGVKPRFCSGGVELKNLTQYYAEKN